MAVALALVLGPPMDTLTRDTDLASRPTLAGRLLAAFDAVDESVDHGHHRPAAVRIHHVQPATTPQARSSTPPSLTEQRLTWTPPDDAAPPSVTVGPAKPPPRV